MLPGPGGVRGPSAPDAGPGGERGPSAAVLAGAVDEAAAELIAKPAAELIAGADSPITLGAAPDD